jgi:outer membrane immunogenic protein
MGVSMRKFTVLSAFVAMLGGVNAAAAADLPYQGGSYKDTGYEAPLAPIWGGLYVGGHVGGLWNDGGDVSKWCRKKQKEEEDGPVLEAAARLVDQRPCRSYEWDKVDNVKFSSNDHDDVTFIGGLHIGYNWQSGARVFGLEADASFGDGVDYLASLRARLGYARDNLLLYVTAGVAFAGFDDSSVTLSHNGHKKTFDFSGDSEVGLVVGAGAEYKLSQNWSIGLEGLYYAFGDSDDSKAWEKFCKEYKLVREDDNDLFVVRARLSYHFQDAYDEPLK